MTASEFSNAFDTLVNSYSNSILFGEQSSKQDFVFDEYEKSLFLTQAQEELAISLYTGKNPYGESFEGTEEVREYLKPLIVSSHKSLTLVDSSISSKSMVRYGNCKTYRISWDEEGILGIIYEEVAFDDNSLGCSNGKVVPVIPVRHDELVNILDNPFRGASKRRVLRIDSKDNGTKAELLSKYALKQDSYYVKYLVKPRPIVLADLGDASVEGFNQNTVDNVIYPQFLPEQLHNRILELAVRKALQSKGYFPQTENKR